MRRDAWRIQLFQEEIAAEAKKRRDAALLHRTILVGLTLGIAGSLLSVVAPF